MSFWFLKPNSLASGLGIGALSLDQIRLGEPVNTDPVVLKYSLCGACWASGWIFELKTWFLEETVWKVCARQVTRVYWSRFGGWDFTRLPTCALTCGSHQPPSHQRHQPAQVSGFPQAKVLQRPYMPLWCHCDAMVWQNLSTPHLPTKGPDLGRLFNIRNSGSRNGSMRPVLSQLKRIPVHSQICETPTRGTRRKVPSQSGISEERFFLLTL